MVMTAGYLPRLPRAVAAWPFRRRNAYVDLQLRARFAAGVERTQGMDLQVGPGELLFSVREAARWWELTEKEVRGIVDFLEAEGLVAYPEGNRHRRMYVMRLTDWWGASKGARRGASKGEINHPSDNDLEATGAQARAQGGAQARASWEEEKGENSRKESSPPEGGEGARTHVGAESNTAPPRRGRGRRAAGAAPAVEVPEDFTPNPTHRQTAAALGLDVDEEARAFVDKARGKGWTYVDVDRGFSTWLRKAAEFARDRAPLVGAGRNGRGRDTDEIDVLNMEFSL